MQPTLWTEAEDAALRIMCAEKKTRDHAASVLGRTRAAVYARTQKLKITGWHGSPDVWPDDQVAILKDLYMVCGFSAGECGKRMGVTRNAVIGIVNRRKWNRSPEVGVQNNASTHRSKPAAAPKKAPPPPQARTLIKVIMPSPPEQPIPTLARPWITRERGECSWPVAGRGAETFSCCTRTEPGKPWCVGHMAVGFVPRQKRIHRAAV